MLSGFPFLKKSKILSIPRGPGSLIYLTHPLLLHFLSLSLSSSFSFPFSPPASALVLTREGPVFAFPSGPSDKLILLHYMPCFPIRMHFTNFCS